MLLWECDLLFLPSFPVSLSSLFTLLSLISGCPEAVKLLVGNKCDLPADVDLSQAKVSEISRMEAHTVRNISGI